MLICSIVHWHSLSMLLSLSLLLAWFVLLAERHCCHHDPTIQSSHVVVLWRSVLLLSKPAESIASTAMVLPYDDGKNLLSLISTSIMMKELCQCGSVTSSQHLESKNNADFFMEMKIPYYLWMPDKIAAWLPKLIITQPGWSSTWLIKDTKVAIKNVPKQPRHLASGCKASDNNLGMHPSILLAFLSELIYPQSDRAG